jgi:glyoxalase family protein
MQFDGIHHISAVTSDAPRNVDFYARVMGLRLVKQTVNQDDPTAYHLFYADEDASAGADLTFFEYPGARRGQAGAGMIHRIVFRVGSADALDFWTARLGREGVAIAREGDSIVFADPDGIDLELVVADSPDAPLVAHAADVPDELALQGFEAVRAYSAAPAASERLLTELGFQAVGEHDWETRGPARGGRIAFDPAPGRGMGGAGTVHHIAWSSTMADHEAWRERVVAAGADPTPVIDRFYFRSVYFREPGGVLYEIATQGPGFAVDEPAESLGERLSLPPQFEPLREKLIPLLTPLPDTRQWRRAGQSTRVGGGAASDA